MITRKYIENRLIKLEVDPSVLDRYDEPHRHYHTLNHIIKMLNELSDMNLLDNDILFLAIVFHDIVYWAYRQDNEKESVVVFHEYFKGDPLIKREVSQIIRDTATHKPNTELSKIVQRLDLIGFEKSCEEMIKNLELIYKEYEPYYNRKTFLKGHLTFVESFKKMGYNVDCLIEYIKKEL